MRTSSLSRAPSRAPSRAWVSLCAVAAATALAGCGGGVKDTAPEQPTTPTAAEYSAWMASTKKDAMALGQAAYEEYQRTKAFPTSPKGLATLSDGNRVGGFDVTADNVQICVEHVRDGKAWVFDGAYVAPDRVNEGSKGRNTGCL